MREETTKITKIDLDHYIYKCPITQEMPINPVVASDGLTYEKEAYERWTEGTGKNTSPITREELFGAAYENRALKDANKAIVELVEICNDTTGSTNISTVTAPRTETENAVIQKLETRRLGRQPDQSGRNQQTRRNQSPVGVVLQGVGAGAIVGGVAATTAVSALGFEAFGALTLTTLASIGVEVGAIGSISAFFGPVGIGVGIVIGIGVVAGVLGYSTYKVITSRSADA